MDGRANRSELLINADSTNKPKRLKGLNQKVSGLSQDTLVLSCADVEPSAERQSLTHHVTYTKRGKPDYLPIRKEGKEWEGSP